MNSIYFCDPPGPIDAPRKKSKKRKVKRVHDHCNSLPGQNHEI